MTNQRQQLIDQVFDAVVDMPAQERERALMDRCDGDAELVVAVRSLLDSADRSDGFLDAPVPAALADFISQQTEPDLVGSTIGDYRVTDLIASGGMGTVYKAKHKDESDRSPVAIKVIRHGMYGPDAAKRFDRERQALSGLHHPNVASMIDGGVTTAGLAYLVMEYIDGESIDAYCDARAASPRERLRLILDVCAAVSHAHRNLLIHRDIKPSNILVGRDGVVKLLDFGIAKLIPEDGSDAAQTRTMTERRVVTPQYAAPEVIRGEPASTAMDVYSLGLVVYELLTGRRPYDLTNRSARAAEEIICDSAPVAPSTVVTRPNEPVSSSGTRKLASAGELARLRDSTPEQLRREYMGDLDIVVAAALHKDTTRRYASVEHFAADIERYLNGFPVLARKDSASYRAKKFYQRHKLGVVAACVMFASLVGGVGAGAYGLLNARAEAHRARVEAAKSSQINAFLQDMLGGADPEHGRTDITVREMMDLASARVDAVSLPDPQVKAAVHRTLGQTYLDLGLADQAESHLRQALALLRPLRSSARMDLCRSLLGLGKALRVTGTHAEAVAALTEALEISRSLPGAATALTVQSMVALSGVRFDQGAFDEATALLRGAVDLAQKSFGDHHRTVAEAMEKLGVTLSDRGRRDEAATLCQQALDINRSLYGPRHVRVSNSLRHLAIVRHQQFKYNEAEVLYREALDIHMELFGERHPQVARIMNNLGVLLRTTGRVVEARTMLERALTLRRDLFGNEHEAVASTLNNLATAMDAVSAEPIIRKSLVISKAVHGARHHSVGRTLQNLATSLKDQRKFAEAEPLYRRSLDILGETFGTNHPSYAFALTGLAEVLIQRQAYAKAEPLLRDSIRSREASAPKNDGLKGTALGFLGAVLLERNALNEAEESLLEAYQITSAVSGKLSPEARTQAAQLVTLYQRMDKPAAAALYQAALSEVDAGSNPP